MLKTFSPVLMAAFCVLVTVLAPLGARGQTLLIPLVTVDNTNNAADSTVMVTDSTTGYGSVGYTYGIDPNDVTVAQYTAFLNAVAQSDFVGCYSINMASDGHVAGIARSGSFGAYTYSVIGSGSNPITYVSWLSAARFCNWLFNGRPTSGGEAANTTEEGVYTLDGDTSVGNETRNAGATWWIPQENEWYKAAYYDPTLNTGTGGYWSYPTASSTTPGNDALTPAVGDQANFINAGGLFSVTQSASESALVDYLTAVGSFVNSASPYQTFDQGGDVYQWNDAVSGSARGVRGGAWDTMSSTLQSNDREFRAATQGFADVGFRVAGSLPVITGSLNAAGAVGSAFSYQIIAANNPSAYAITNPPGGVTVSSSTGLISGTPTQSGTFNMILLATNAAGSELATLQLIVAAFPIPAISGTLSVTGTDLLPFSYQIMASGSVSSYGATGLPPGLTVTSSNGLISGTITQSGTFSATLSAVNLGGTGTATLAIDVLAPPQPVVSSTLSATGTDGLPFNYQIDASFEPASYAASNLPSNLTIDGSTGLISGTPAQTGTFAPTISAINSGGTGTATLALTILPPLPVITSALTASGTNGAAFTYVITGSNSPISYNAVGLPPGLMVDGSTGVISGTIGAGGLIPITLEATSPSGTGSATLILAISTNFNGLQGSYVGLVAVDGTKQGLFTASLTSQGVFTAKLATPAAQYSLKGTYSNLGTFGSIQAENGAILDVILNVDATLPVPELTGTVIAETLAGTQTYSMSGGLLGVFSARKPLPKGIAGYYTAVVPGLSGTDKVTPHAPGYGTMVVSGLGAVTIAGKLADGMAFATRAQLEADGKTWTLYTALPYSKTAPGTLAGTMTFEPLPESDCDGTADWIKPPQASGAFYPGGFAEVVTPMAAAYKAPALATGTGSITFSDGELDTTTVTGTTSVSVTGTTYDITVAQKGSTETVTVPSAPGTTAVIDPANGLFSGKFKDFQENDVEVPFGGVIYKKPTPAGFGLYLGGNQSSGVQLSQ